MTINHKAQQAWAALWRMATNVEAHDPPHMLASSPAWPTWHPNEDRNAMIRRAFE